jgi:putative protein-disulfide isomerase
MSVKFLLKIVIVFSLYLSAETCFAQDNCPIKKATLLPSNDAERQQLLDTNFPIIEVKNLATEGVKLPEFTMGKATIICILLKDEGRPVASSWTKNILQKYPHQEVNLYEISLLPKGLKILRGTIEKGMRKDVDTGFHKYFTTYFGDIGGYKNNLKIKDANSAYVFLLDKFGKIKFTADGYCDDAKATNLYTKILDLNGQMPETKSGQKDTITYVFDPLCGFCYAFEPEMKKLADKYKDKFVFEIVSGGMILGEGEGPIGKVAPHIAHGYKDLEKMSEARFGANFLNKIMKEGTYKMSSEMPSIAVEVFKSLQPENAIAFANDVQMMLYYDGVGLNEPENYTALATKYGLKAAEFVEKLKQPEWKAKAYAGFATAQKMGVESFPTLFLKHNKDVKLIHSGFEKYEKLVKMYPFN